MRANTQQTRGRLILFTLMATLALAMAFTFNACSGDDTGGNSPSGEITNGGSGSLEDLLETTPITSR